MKVLVAHPGKQHSYRMATALKKGNMLDSYVTTVYYKENNLTSKVLRFLNRKDLRKAQLRKCDFLDDVEVFQKHEFLGLVILLCLRLRLSKTTNWLSRMQIYVFGISVAKMAIERKVDAVIMYDNTAVPCFAYLKKYAPNIKRILDASTVNRLYIKEIYEKDMNENHYDFFRKQLPFLWNHKRQGFYKKEIELSDYILLPSKFVEKSYLYSNVCPNKLIRIPYGVDVDKFKCSKRRPHDGMINLLYVGQVTYYKGLQHLLPIIRDRYAEKIKLTMVGGYDRNDFLYKEYGKVKNIEFRGFVPNVELPRFYQDADAFIIPSLGEGYGLVILEALSSALPVLCSANCGGNDAIINGYNGYEFKAGDDEDMVDKINDFIDNFSSLSDMSENARATSLNYTWEKYEGRVIEFFKNLEQK